MISIIEEPTYSECNEVSGREGICYCPKCKTARKLAMQSKIEGDKQLERLKRIFKMK